MDAILKQELQPAFSAFFGQYGEWVGRYFGPNELGRILQGLDAEGDLESMEIPFAHNLIKAVMYLDDAASFALVADVIPTKYLADASLRDMVLRFLDSVAEESEADAIRYMFFRALSGGVATIDEVIRALKASEFMPGESEFKEGLEPGDMSSIAEFGSTLCEYPEFRSFAISRLGFAFGDSVGGGRPYADLIPYLMLYPDSQQALVDLLRRPNENDSEFREYLLVGLSALEPGIVGNVEGVPIAADPFLDLCFPQGQLKEVIAEITKSGSDYEQVLAQEILEKME